MSTARRLAAICWPPGSRCAAAGGQANGRQNRPFPWRCPPTLRWQNQPFVGRCPPTRRARAPTRAPSASACEPYRELIVEALGRGRNAVAIWQDLVDDHGFSARYASVRRFVAETARHGARRGARRHHDRARRRRPGRLRRRRPMVRDRSTGKYRRTRLFVLTLGCSRKSVRLLVWRSSAQIWAELHERAFRRLGGTVRVIVLDNLKEGVLTPGHLRPRAESALSRCARALRGGRPAVPRRRSRSQREGRSRRRPRAEDAAQRPALRDVSTRRKRTWIAGRRAGPTRASTARRSGKSP